MSGLSSSDASCVWEHPKTAFYPPFSHQLASGLALSAAIPQFQTSYFVGDGHFNSKGRDNDKVIQVPAQQEQKIILVLGLFLIFKA